jgi:hypothetical protein
MLISYTGMGRLSNGVHLRMTTAMEEEKRWSPISGSGTRNRKTALFRRLTKEDKVTRKSSPF